MVAAAVRDRVVGVGVAVAAGLILLTAWVLGIAAVVVLLAPKLGMAGALGAVCAGLVLLALGLVSLSRARSRVSAEQRATTRALWVATAVNAASTLLRRDVRTDPSPEPAEPSSPNHRSILLIAGGLVLILLAFLVPSARDDGSPDKADGAADPDPGPDGTA
jgi:hypothetical protein